MSKTAKTYWIYAGLGLIPAFLYKLLPTTLDGENIHFLTHSFPYPLYMGLALVGFLCF